MCIYILIRQDLQVIRMASQVLPLNSMNFPDFSANFQSFLQGLLQVFLTSSL